MSPRISAFFLFFLFSQASFALPTAKVTIKVVDQEGVPVEGAIVEVYFKMEGYRSNKDVGLTDSEGLFEASGSTQRYVGGCNITKDGYYASGCDYSEKNLTNVSGIMGFRRWQPWNPKIEVMLKKIKNPIALYMRDIQQLNKDYKFNLVLPAFKAGFDLIESDWVAPYGSGSSADIIFQLVKNHESYDSFEDELIITFSNPNDGIQLYRTPKGNSSTFRLLIELIQLTNVLQAGVLVENLQFSAFHHRIELRIRPDGHS